MSDWTYGELIEDMELGQQVTLQEWCAAHRWAVTTLSDCLGMPPFVPHGGERQDPWALYDADEDDPPIATFSFREDAERVAEILNIYGGRTTEGAE